MRSDAKRIVSQPQMPDYAKRAAVRRALAVQIEIAKRLGNEKQTGWVET